jgi:hypothetical protein
VSECALPVKWAGDEKLKEPTDADLRIQAERVAKTFACSLHEGSAETFYFLLPHYVERQTQFGIVRPDLTPRPAFVALAAVGRLLAGAKSLGRVKSNDPGVRAFLFRARPDGRASDVLVAWTTSSVTTLYLPPAPREILDHLGRAQAIERELRLTSAPLFAVFRRGSARQFSLAPPSKPPPFRKAKPSPVVLQALWPEGQIDLKLSAYRFLTGAPVRVSLFVYNFGRDRLRGQLHVTAPDGWRVTLPEMLELAPQERRELTLLAEETAPPMDSPAVIRISGDFGRAGKPVLSFRLKVESPDR